MMLSTARRAATGHRKPVAFGQSSSAIAPAQAGPEPHVVDKLERTAFRGAEVPSLEMMWTATWLQDEGVGRLVTNAEAEVMWVCPAAAKLLKGDTPLAIDCGRLVGKGRRNRTFLEELLIESATKPSKVDGLFIPADEEVPTLFVQLKRCSRSNHVAVQLKDLRAKVQEFPDLVRLYGLTKSEYQTVCLLLNGQSVNQIAERLSNSILTVRSHLKRVYSKLDISTKEQLFSIVIRMVAA